ncbi:MAG: tRNA 2-thiouridine(34) synthase MnmA [Lachnospiraceae bacterium]|nr:tRNA 2-thiouridine(34) synthase MnmA [Lachnospiraceae bacterium]
MEKNGKRALIGMSGGVDSSAAAAVMVEEGYECIGATMKLYQNEDVNISRESACCSLDDVEDARAVAYRLGIPHYVLNFTEDFSREVIDRFVQAYEEGRTPNPCIDCNRYIKFERMYHRAMELECDYVVTGHYARIEYKEETGRWCLKRAVNRAKDQSYVLCFLTQEQLAHTKLPLGEFESKDAVRAKAEGYAFVNAAKHDSQDICFVPEGNYTDFIKRRTGRTYPEGDFVDQEGKVLGRHKGLIRYTIGQRKGLGLALPAPLFVCSKDMENNRVILGPSEKLFTRELSCRDFNWISREAPAVGEKISVTGMPRYRAKEAPAQAWIGEDGLVHVVFDEPQRAITSGQAVVLYDGDYVVGGGTIL